MFSAAIYLGCYQDSAANRLLPLFKIVNTNDNNKVTCGIHCLEHGLTYAGTQFRKECFCGAQVSERPENLYEATSLVLGLLKPTLFHH